MADESAAVCCRYRLDCGFGYTKPARALVKHKEFLNALAVVYGRKDEEGALLINDHWSIVHLNSNEIETLK